MIHVLALHDRTRSRRVARRRATRRGFLALSLSAVLALLAVTPASGEPPVKRVELRAPRADGSGPHPTPGANGPWVDLAGGHDATLINFYGTLASGWVGDGTPASPFRLELGGFEEHLQIAAGTVPELQVPGPVSIEMWFRTSLDGPVPRADYLCEWLSPGDGGMSVAILDGQLAVYESPGWARSAWMSPATWYHVAVVKDSAELRVYRNGHRVHTSGDPNPGTQQTPITLGASCFRLLDGQGSFGDYLHGAIAGFTLWQGALDDAAVLASFRADSASFPPPPAPGAPVKLLSFNADLADGSGPYAGTGASPWVDLMAPRSDAALYGFETSGSGWESVSGAAHCLRFDGVDDVAVVGAGGVAELQDLDAVTVQVWFQSEASPSDPAFHFLTDWAHGYASERGMALAVRDGQVMIYLGEPAWQPIAPVATATWQCVTVVKRPGETRAYLNGVLRMTTPVTLLGDVNTELMIGASTWRGPGQYGDHFHGGIARYDLWRGALDDAAVLQAYLAEAATFQPPLDVAAPGGAGGFALTGFRSNPARGDLRVRFTLAGDAPATLELIDVTGRAVRRRSVAGSGAQQIDLGAEGRVSAGIYFLRLRQAGQDRVVRAAVLD